MIEISIKKELHLSGGDGQLQVDVQIADGELVALYGPSGAGKTSLLRILAGLMQPEQGYIAVNGQVWLDTTRKINLPPQKRSVGFLFQDYALFPNMTVRQNLMYALPAKADPLIADRLLQTMQLDALAHQKPALLSGGQKQRVALARALLRQPQLLLLDEPLSALDHHTRLALQQEIKNIHQQYQTTTFLVSHDVPEIYKLAQKVIELHNGGVKQVGSPTQVFNLPVQQNGILIFGEVVSITNQEVNVITNDGLISIKASTLTDNLQAGDKVTIHAADLSLKKLS
jgi:molybdate transport system ATP-binding protein